MRRETEQTFFSHANIFLFFVDAAALTPVLPRVPQMHVLASDQEAVHTHDVHRSHTHHFAPDASCPPSICPPALKNLPNEPITPFTINKITPKTNPSNPFTEPNAALTTMRHTPRWPSQRGTENLWKEPITCFLINKTASPANPPRVRIPHDASYPDRTSILSLLTVIAICNMIITNSNMTLGEKIRYLREVEGALRGLDR